MPIYLTFCHGRNVFQGKQFARWVSHFKTAEFKGFECGNYYPTLEMNMCDFADEVKAHNPVDDAEIAARVWMHLNAARHD